MAEEKAGKRMNFQVGGLSSLISGGQGQSQGQQKTQSTGSTQTGAQQSTSTPFLPGITNNQEIQAQNKIQTNNGFIEGIQQGKIQTNIQLPGITTKPQTGATLDTTTMKQKRQSYIYASNNNINTKSINEQIEEERASGSKVLGQTGKILKTYRETPINNFKKRGARAIADSGLPGYFVDKTLNKAGLDISVKDSVNEVARKMALQYQDSVNEKFQKKVEKNLDPYIKEKYDNASITDLIGQGDGAGAWYKMRRGTVENRNMIPEMGLMFVNPYVGLAAMGTDVYIQENQGTFEDMMENGATYDEAKNGAVAVGILNAGIELFMERFLGGTKWAGATAFRRLFLKNAQREVVKTATKKGMAEIFARGVGEWLKGSMVEGFEEVLQQIVGNIMVKMVNPDRDITEGTRESFEGGFYNLFNPIGGGINMVNDVKTNKQIQKNADIEALNYVMEGEQRKAQRVQEAKQRMRDRFLQKENNPTMDNGYTPTPEQAQQRATEKEENERYEDELKTEQNREIEIENDMINEVLNEGDINEDLGDSRYQKSDSPQSVNEDTVSERSHAGNVRISPENSSEITKSLNEIKKNLNDLKADAFLQQIKKSISGAEGSNYIINKINGKNYVLRVANHHANANNSIRHPKRNTSIVIKLMKRGDEGKNIRFKKNKNVDLVEFVYNPENMTPEIMQGIIDGVQNWIQTGEYTDTHYDDMKQSTRTKGQKTTEGKLQKNSEEEYKPGVAKKSEKNISGKEGLNLRNKLNKKTVKQLAEKYGIKTEVIEGMIKILEKGKVEGYAYGKYLDQLLTLSEQIKESTAPHELLHAIFDMIDPETKTYLISQVMASEGWTAEQSEEWLADSFSNFFRTGKIESAPKSTRGKIKIFFKRVRSFINGMNKWRNELEQIFTDILEANGIEDLQGRIDRNDNLQKSKEKMKKRFMEYEKNAEKVKKKENDGKYQTVYHGGPNEFDRFDHLHMGEGEGHQAHGRGHYVAVDPKTARNYAENFSRYKGGTIHIDSLSTDEDLVAYKVLSNLQMGMSLEDSMEDVKSYYRDEKKFYENAYKEDKIDRFKELAERSGRLIKAVDKLNKSDFNTKRNFYEVEIPDPVKANTPTGSNYLEEKGELTEKQLNNFKKILEKYNLPNTNKWLNEGHIKNGEDLYSSLSEDFNSDAGASKFLEKMGYDGIHYFGGRDGEAYVIFNDNALEIKNHEKYQKTDDIDPEVKSPEDMIEKNTEGLDIMVKFISEKQKKNALNVSEEILTKDGKPYMWTNTNKYMSKVITDWRNVEDSKYKEFTDEGIQVSRFTNNSEMSYSYANYDSKLAPVKKFKSIEEINKFLKDNPNDYRRELGNGINDGYFESHTTYSIKKGDSGYELISENTEHNVRDIDKKYEDINNDWMGDKIGEMPKDKNEAIKKLQEYYNEREYQIDGVRTVELFENDKVKITTIKEPIIIKRFNTKQEALAEGYIEATKSDLYHYQGIIQKLNNPLVVDGEGRTRANLGKTYDFLKEHEKDMDKKLDEFKKYLQKAVDERNTFSWTDMEDISKVKDKLREEYYDAKKNWMGDDTEMNTARDKITLLREATESIENMIYRGGNEFTNTISEEQRNFKIKGDKTLGDIYDKAVKLHNKYDVFDVHFGNVYNIQDYIKQKLPDIAYYINHSPNFMQKVQGLNGLLNMDLKDLLTQDMETNDFVFYALKKGGYDGVVFKNIVDYGGTPKDGWANAKGGDVVTTFKSNQFKTWDNENPTDSKYIRYQKVYHGSPNEFDRFDSSHMGEGEGNQAHGRGHYVAVDPQTARRYAQERFYKNEIEVKGRTMARVDDTWDIPYALRSLYRDLFNTFAMGYYDVEEEAQKVLDRSKKEYEETVEYFEDLIKNDTKPLVEVSEKDLEKIREDRKKSLEEFKEALEFVEELTPEDVKVSEIKDRRNFYEVEIPDPVKADTPTGKNYIEEENRIGVRAFNRMLKRFEKDGWEVESGYGNYTVKKGNDEITLTNPNNTWKQLIREDIENPKLFSQILNRMGYNGIHYYGGVDGEAYVVFNDNDLEIKNHEKYQKAEYEYDENGNITNLKFGDNSERDPSIFGTPTREEQIEDDKENEKGNPFYNAWMRYNNQNYKDDQLTMDEFMQGISERGDKEQEEYNKKMKDLSEIQNDPQLLDLQLRAVKLMEEEGKVGKKFGKNVSKEVRDRQQKEVETKREKLVEDILSYMYPGLKTEEITYDMQKEADKKEADWEMLGREDIEEKLKYFKKDKNGNREAKEIKIENPQIKLDKILSSGKFDEIFPTANRVIEFTTPNGQKGVLDSTKDPAKYKRTLTRINDGTVKTKVKMRDITNETRANEKMKAEEQAERERIKKERQEALAKKKQEEYKKMVRMKAFQKLIDMKWIEEKYPFLTEKEIKERYGFTNEEWKKITEQEEIKLPKRWTERAISDFNKAVDSYTKDLITGLSWQNNMKRKDHEKNLGEIGDVDIEVLLGKDEEKGQKEVEEFENLAKEEKKKEEKVEEGKSEWEKEMDRKTRKQKKQAEKLTKEWNDMFRKAEEKRNERYANKEEKVIDEVKTKEEAEKLTKENRRTRTKKWMKDTTIQDLIQPISSRIEKISPRIYLEMMRFEQRIAIKTNIRMKQVEDFIKTMAKVRSENKKEYLNLTLHLLNGNVGTANQILEKYGGSIPRQVLDEIWADSEDVGYTMNYEGFYYPRKVKDVKEFLDRFDKTENSNVQSEIEKIIKKKREQARKRGEEFTKQQEADLINQLLMDGEVEGITLGSGHMKQRKVDSITKNMLEFYEDPVDALLQYITGMTEAIEKARFLGQGKKGEIKTLGEFISDEGVKGWDAEELEKLLLSRFNYAPMSKGVAGLKNIANIIHLGSPSSALSQLADISFSLIENGLTNIVEGLAGKYNLDLDALGITNRGEELKSQGKNESSLDKIQRFTFRWTGFNMMDQFGKKLLVVSTLNKLKKYAKKNDPQLRKDLSRRFDDPKMIDGVIEDLKNGVMSENVNLFLFTKLADVQPLTRMQMPKIYLTSGNGRIFYQFKTFAVKQLDYMIQKGKRDLQTKGTAKGLWSIALMMGIIMLCGAATDEIKDFTMGRKYSSWIWRMINDDDWSVSMLSDRFWDNLLKLTGLTKYSIYQARTQGIKSTVEDLFFSVSGLDVLTYPMQDIQDAFSEDGLDFSQASSWQLIPIVGKYGYWWAGAGQTKQQKKLDKEKKTTTSGGSSRSSTRNSRSNRSSRNTRNSR